MDDIVRDAVMLGVAAVQPLVTTRAETTVAALARGARLDRWRRVALASVKQSGRAVLPEIRRPLTLESFLDDPAAALRADARRAGRQRRRRAAVGAARGAGAAGCDDSGRPRRRVGGGGVDGRAGPRRAPRDASAAARCAPTRRRSPRSACCSFSGAICSGRSRFHRPFITKTRRTRRLPWDPSCFVIFVVS